MNRPDQKITFFVLKSLEVYKFLRYFSSVFFPEVCSVSQRNFGDEMVYFSEKVSLETFRTTLGTISFKK